MLDVAWSTAAALNILWARVAEETLRRVLQGTDRATFRRKVRSSLLSELPDRFSAPRRAIRRLADDPAVLLYVLDPKNSEAESLFDERLAQLLGLEHQELLANAGKAVVAAVWSSLLESVTPVERALLDRSARVESGIADVLEMAMEQRDRLKDLQATLDGLVQAWGGDARRFLDGSPFLMSDPSVMEQYGMSSEVAGGVIPDYVQRDIDPYLRTQLADARLGFVAVAGRPKSGKTRTLLEGLLISSPSTVLFPVARSPHADAVWAVASAVAENPPPVPWALLIDDLHLHLLDEGIPASFGFYTNLAAASEIVHQARRPGRIFATIDRRFATLSESSRTVLAISGQTQVLLSKALILPDTLTDVELGRARRLFPGLSDEERSHLPERLAAIPQLRQRAAEAIADQPRQSERLALLLAACQLSIAEGTLAIHRDELRRRATKLYTYLVPRSSPALSESALDSAEAWATQVIGATYALMTPRVGSASILDLSDVIRGEFGPKAMGPLTLCEDVPWRLVRLGNFAHVALGPQEAASIFRRLTEDDSELVVSFSQHLLAHCLHDLGDESGARQNFEAAVRAADADIAAAASTCFGEYLYARGEREEAEKFFRRAVESGIPEWSTRALHGYAHARADAGDRDEAIAALERAATSEVREIARDALLCLAPLVRERDGREAARRLLQRAMALGELQGVLALYAGNLLGEIAMEQGDATSAVEAFVLAVRAFPAEDTAQAALHYGEALEKAGARSEAHSAYSVGVQSGELASHPVQAVQLAIALSRLGDPNGAISAWEAVVAGDSELAPIAAINLGKSRTNVGDLSGALNAFERARDIGDVEQRMRALYDWASVQVRLGALDEALSALDEVAESPDHQLRGLALHARGHALVQKGCLEDARVAFQAANVILPPELRKTLAACGRDALANGGSRPCA